jgi:pimeloyl-ACP methyl ester carboxylesterase
MSCDDFSQGDVRRCDARWPGPRRRAWVLSVGLLAAGCGAKLETPVVIFLDGAGHFGYAGNVRQGLRQGGYDGRFQSFMWTWFLGPGVDHLLVARAGARASALAHEIERLRAADPDGPIHLIGLSAGTAILVTALEELAPGVQVDNVVLLSSSISAGRDLRRALDHVRGHLYATASPEDGILAMTPLNADGGTGSAVGQVGVRMPTILARAERAPYRKVVNLPWRPAYAGYGWTGGHTSVTSPRFIESVIAPRLRSDALFPLDRPLYRAPELTDDPGLSAR